MTDDELVKVELLVHAKDVSRIKKMADDLTKSRAFHRARGRELPSLEEVEAMTKASVKQALKPKRPAERKK